MRWMLDTNACIAVLNDRPALVRARLADALEAGAEILVPVIVVHELWFGVEKSARKDRNAAVLQVLLARFETVPFGDDDAAVAARIRADLRERGEMIRPYDILIAAQALRTGSTLVTNNTGEFRRVQGLTLADWTQPS